MKLVRRFMGVLAKVLERIEPYIFGRNYHLLAMIKKVFYLGTTVPVSPVSEDGETPVEYL